MVKRYKRYRRRWKIEEARWKIASRGHVIYNSIGSTILCVYRINTIRDTLAVFKSNSHLPLPLVGIVINCSLIVLPPVIKAITYFHAHNMYLHIPYNLICLEATEISIWETLPLLHSRSFDKMSTKFSLVQNNNNRVFILFTGAIGALWNAPPPTRNGPIGLGCRIHFTMFIAGKNEVIVLRIHIFKEKWHLREILHYTDWNHYPLKDESTWRSLEISPSTNFDSVEQ